MSHGCLEFSRYLLFVSFYLLCSGFAIVLAFEIVYVRYGCFGILSIFALCT